MDRFYTFKCISYAPIDHLTSVCSVACNHWCIILHDKDINEDGTPKEPHHHLVLTFSQNKSIESVRRLFSNDTDQNTLAKPSTDIIHDTRYLTHIDYPEKYQYDWASVICDNAHYWDKKYHCANETKDDEFLDDLLGDDYTPRMMAQKYGRDYIKNFRRYEEFRFYVLGAEHNARVRIMQDEVIENIKKFEKNY